MASSNILIGSFTYIVARVIDFEVKRLEKAPFDPNIANAGVYSMISEWYARRVISKFNFHVGIELVIPRYWDVASLCPLGFSVAYVDKLWTGLSLPVFPFLLMILTYYDIVLPQLQPYGVRVVIAFYLHCLKMDVLSSIFLFKAFFILKAASPRD